MYKFVGWGETAKYTKEARYYTVADKDGYYFFTQDNGEECGELLSGFMGISKWELFYQALKNNKVIVK